MAERLRVVVAYSPAPREVVEVPLELAAPATVRDAVQASGLAEMAAADLTGSGAGIWGRKALPGDALRDGDRVEIYRPLRIDPKVARRERFGRQGARATGLFAKKRPGAKPGY